MEIATVGGLGGWRMEWCWYRNENSCEIYPIPLCNPYVCGICTYVFSHEGMANNDNVFMIS